MLPQSSVQISGRSSSTWTSRSRAPTRSVPVCVERERRLGAAQHQVAAHPGGQVDDDVDVGAPGRARPPRGRAQGRASRGRSPGRAHGCGRWRRPPGPPRSRHRRSATGVTGTSGLRPVVSPAPVTAQVMNASQFTRAPARPRAPRGAPSGRARQSLLGHPLARPPDVHDHHGPHQPVEHGRGDAVLELLELPDAGAVAECGGSRPAARSSRPPVGDRAGRVGLEVRGEDGVALLVGKPGEEDLARRRRMERERPSHPVRARDAGRVDLVDVDEAEAPGGGERHALARRLGEPLEQRPHPAARVRRTRLRPRPGSPRSRRV